MDNEKGEVVNTAISDVLSKLKKEDSNVKEGVDLADIAKKLSSKKFGKDKKR